MHERTLRRVVVGLGFAFWPGCGAGDERAAGMPTPAAAPGEVVAPATGAPPADAESGGTPTPVPTGGEAVVPEGVPLEPGMAPTTGATADGEGSEAAPLDGDIVFSEPSGTFQGTLTIGISTPIEGAEIRYTLDGSAPGLDAPLYDGNPLVVDQTRQVRAQAFVGGAVAGNSGTALYVARTVDATSDLPIIVLEGYGAGKPEDRDVYVDMALLVYEPLEGVASLQNPPTLATRGGYHLRGQSSATFEQAPYRVELWDNASEDLDQPLLGMPADSDWAFIGPYSDRTLIRNAFVYDLGREMGLPAPRYAFAEVYINQAARPVAREDYQGIYMVVETIKNNKDRLDLAQLEEGDVAPDVISGGYIFKFEWAASEQPTLTCSGSEPLGGGFGGFGMVTATPSAMGGQPAAAGTCWTDLEVADPDPLAPAQADFLTGYIQQFHDALHESAFATYSQLIDTGSFVDVFIINELTRNLDAYTRSAYYYKDRGQPIFAGPLWDFNLTLGMGFGTNLEVEGWQFEERNVASDWFRILGSDPEFMARVSQRWAELRPSLLSEAALTQRIDALAAPLASAAVRDFARWPVADVAQGIFQIPTEPTWEGQLEVMRTWLGERLAWLDTQLL
jgi:CotH protein/chitobiase/beta-hexosaminidase-like protein